MFVMLVLLEKAVEKLDIINLDLPRKVRYKKRKYKNNDIPKKDTKIRMNRTYEDFKDYVKITMRITSISISLKWILLKELRENHYFLLFFGDKLILC